MVNFNALSKAMQQEITRIMAGDGANAQKIDSRNEYDQLSQLLSGASGADEKSYIENLMFKYEEEYEVTPGTRKAVAEIINRRSETTADLRSEIDDLKAYKKEHKRELSDADKKYIDDVIKGKSISLEGIEETEPEAEEPPQAEEEKAPEKEAPEKEATGKQTPPLQEESPQPAPHTDKPRNQGVGNGNKGNGNGVGNVGNGTNNRGNAGRDINVGPGGANGDNNHSQVGNQTNQQGIGNVNGDNSSVNINITHDPKYKPFGL